MVEMVDVVESGTERIHFHIASWYDEVEDLDNAEKSGKTRVCIAYVGSVSGVSYLASRPFISDRSNER